MIALQTLWTKPLSIEEIIRDLPIMALSVATVSNFYDLHIVTDRRGYEIFSQLDLPNVKDYKIILDNNPYNKELWASAKYMTYQEFAGEDFIHFDLDVILERKLVPQKDFLFDCHESLYFPNNMGQLHNAIRRVFGNLEIDFYRISSNTYNVGCFYMRDKALRQSYILQGKMMLDMIQERIESPDKTLNKEDGGICMIYVEQYLLDNYVNHNDAEFVRDSKYFQRLDNLSTIDKIHMREFTSEYNITEDMLNKHDYSNLMKVNSTGYCHLFSFLRRQGIPQLQVEYYLKKYYPKLYNTVKELQNKLK